MIVDIHTHTPTHRNAVPAIERQSNSTWRPDRVVEAAVSWGDYLAAMAMVDRACVFGIRFKGNLMPTGREGVGLQWSGNVNDLTAALVQQDPMKLVGFMSVHPEETGVLDEIHRCAHDLGFRGIKLGPNYQGFDPLGREAFRVYEAAVGLGLPILFHQGTSPMRAAPLRYAHPLVMDEIALAFPALRVVMAHMGHPWQADTIAVIRKHPHVYADVSAQFYRPWSQYTALRLAIEWGVEDKLLFGSDFPAATPQETVDGLLAADIMAKSAGLPPIGEDALHRIIHRDSLTLLGISA